MQNTRENGEVKKRKKIKNMEEALKKIKGRREAVDLACEAIYKHPQRIPEYQSGNGSIIGIFMGEAMKISRGNGNADYSWKHLSSCWRNNARTHVPILRFLWICRR